MRNLNGIILISTQVNATHSLCSFNKSQKQSGLFFFCYTSKNVSKFKCFKTLELFTRHFKIFSCISYSWRFCRNMIYIYIFVSFCLEFRKTDLFTNIIYFKVDLIFGFYATSNIMKGCQLLRGFDFQKMFSPWNNSYIPYLLEWAPLLERAPPLLKSKDYIGQKQRITLQCVKNNLKN